MTTTQVRSVLSNPVFINPQGYLVFPQLANISQVVNVPQKSIEKAVYTGELDIIIHSGNIIYNITSNSIEFTTDGECLFTIVQNTDNGSVVLGRWRVSGPELIMPILRYSTKGKTNQDADRDTIKDLMGTGNDLNLYNFGFTGMSGYGGFNGALIPTTSQNKSLNYKTLTSNKIEIVGIKNDITITDTTNTNKNFLVGPGLFMTEPGKIKVTVECDYPIEVFLASEGGGTGLAYTAFRNGTKEIEHTTHNRYLYGRFAKIAGGSDVYPATDSFKLTIEIPAEYPDGLVLDGVDDFLQNSTHMPFEVKDYTIILKRKFLYTEYIQPGGCTLSCGNYRGDGLFAMECKKIPFEKRLQACSIGKITIVDNIPELISYQTRDSYNGQDILNGEYYSSAFPIIVGKWGQDEYAPQSLVFYDLLIYNKILTPEQIQQEIIKYNL